MSPTRTWRRPALLAPLTLVLLASALLAACSDGDSAAPAASPPPTAEASSTATATPTAAAGTPTASATRSPTATPSSSEAAGRQPFSELFSEPDAGRAFEHLRVLAQEIGSRSAGSAAEREAAEYIAAQFEAAGYDVSIEEFEATFESDTSSLTIEGEGPPIAAFAMTGAPLGEASAALVFAGLGAPGDFLDVDVQGAVVLLDRGLLTFANKARNAEAAGAAAVVVVNNEPGPFRGGLGDNPRISIPVLSVAGDLGPALRKLAEDGARVTVHSESGVRSRTSQNVVARPPGGTCSAYLGAHYDSVPQGPGANDNASGTALLIELAHTNRVEGLCAVAFGAEEVGLFGSRAFVVAHDVSEADFMLNFDMVARIGGPRMIAGDIALADLATSIASALGHDIPRGSFPANSSSDHASFSQAGVAAITVHSGGDDFIHTAQDSIDTVFVEDLAILLEIATELLRTLLGD